MGFNGLMKLDIQKFASGTISGGNYNSIYSYYMTWTSTSNGSQANTSNVTLKWIMKKNASDPYGAYNTSGTSKVTLTINGSSQTFTANFDMRSSATGATATLATYTVNNIAHNADGSKSINVSGSHVTGLSWGTKSIGSTSITLDKIARYTNTSTWAVSSKTETSFTLNWKTDDVCSSIRYGTSTSSYTTKSVNANSGTVTISGLSANTSYTLYFMPCRKDSGLWGNGSSGTWKSLSSQKTHPYPTVTAAPSFVIGNTNVSITLNNPLSRTTSVAIKDANGNTIRTLSTSSATAKYDSSLDSVTLYGLIPNNPSGTYTATATWSGHTTTAKSGTFSVNTTTDKPNFSAFEWEDVNTTTCELTKGTGATTSDIVVIGYSNIKGTISFANRAIAKNNAYMVGYYFTSQDRTNYVDYSLVNPVYCTLNKVVSPTFKMKAVDSRYLSTEVSLTANNVVNYVDLIKGDASLTRTGGVAEETTLTFDANMWVGNFGVFDNEITNVTYQYKTGSGNYVTGTTTITPTVDQDGNVSFSGLIKGDTDDGFDVANVYTVQVTVYDKLSSITWTFTLPSGIPHVAYYEKGVSIMGKYDEARTDALQVNGNANIKGNILKNGINMFNIVSSTNNNGNVKIGGIGIEWHLVSITSGTSSVTYQGTNYYSAYSDITYSNTYANTPTVMVTWSGQYANQASTFSANKSTTGARVGGYLLSSESQRTITYVVIGKLA